MAQQKMSKVTTAADAAEMFLAELPRGQSEERVFVLPLDANGVALSKPILVSVGHEDGTAVIDAGMIFRAAFKADAHEIIIAHNHPSGDITPSQADLDATKQLRQGAELVGLRLLDHLVIGSTDSEKGKDFVSLAEILGFDF